MAEEEGGLDVDTPIDGPFSLHSPVIVRRRVTLALRGGHAGKGTATGVSCLVELAHHSNKIIL